MDFSYLLFSQAVSFNSFTFSDIFSLILTVILLMLSGFISASEVAFFSLTPKTLETMETSTNPKDKRILQLLETPQRLLAAILIGNNLVNVSIILILTLVTNRVLDFSQAPVVGFIFQTVIITFLLLLFGEILPKIYASRESRKVTQFTASGMAVMEIIFSPVIKLLINSTTLVNSRLARLNNTNISIDELSQALELTSDERS